MNALLPYWLRLTGGELGCPRGRFALTMLAAYGVYHLLLPLFIRCFATLNLHGALAEANVLSLTAAACAGLMTFVSVLLAFLPLSPLALLGLEENLFHSYELLRGAAAPATPVPDALWPCWLGFLFCAPVLLLAGGVAFGAAWRRLKDAGRSPFFLLLGLTYLLGFDNNGSYSAEAAGLYMLGPLWLIILYSQPSRSGSFFELFRTPPAWAATARQNAPAAPEKQQARRKGNEKALTSSPLSRGKNQSSAGTRPSPSNGAESYRRRMRQRVQAARKRS